MGLCYVDGEIDIVEEVFVKKLAEDIGIDNEVYEIIKRDVEEYSIILGIISGHVIA